jgi:hypothetical protein
VTYETVSESPNTLPRVVRFVLTDGKSGTSVPAYKTVTVTAVNDPPVIALPGPALDYIKRSVAVNVDTLAAVTDADSTDFNTGQLTITFGNNWQIGDLLGIKNEGTAPGEIGVSGPQVTWGGTVIGTWSGGSADVPFHVPTAGSRGQCRREKG